MKQRVIALGLFDGVHLGHGELLRTARLRADGLDCPASVLTFSPPPMQVVSGEKVLLINTAEERKSLMARLYGMDEVLTLPFDATFAAMPWDTFLTTLLETYHACHIVAGFDFRFGADGVGDAMRLRAFCASHSIGCDIVDEVSIDGVKVASSHIRTLLAEGNLAEAERFLGHPHYMELTVLPGNRVGRTIGAPTINHIPSENVLLLPYGVYATTTEIDGVSYRSVTNLGVRPSVSTAGEVSVETHILDFDGDLYGKILPLTFRFKIRDERKFHSLDALRAQIKKDMQTARED